jgi:hypothetical protein
MNYIRELNAFWEWALVERPSTGQVALYLALMSVDNKTGWQGSFTAPNIILQFMTGLSRQGLDKARSGLITKGRIRYKKGHSNKAGTYEIIPFCDYQKVGTQQGDSQKVGTETPDSESYMSESRHIGRHTSRHTGSTLYKPKQNDLQDDHINNNNPSIISPQKSSPDIAGDDFGAAWEEAQHMTLEQYLSRDKQRL